MIIWTVKEGEPLPLAECKGRIMRCGIISDMLSSRGHNVIWWSSDFLHQTKERLSVTGEVRLSENYSLMLNHSPIVYKKNISFNRVLYSEVLSKVFRQEAKRKDRPNVIYCSFPLVDLAYEAVRYAKDNCIPIIVDVRDLWPDIIYNSLPHYSLKKVGKALLNGMERKAQYVLRNADYLTATVPFDLEWAQKKVNRVNSSDKVFFMGYEIPTLSSMEKESIKKELDGFHISEDDFIVCYFGNLTNTIVDFCTLLEAADMLKYRTNIKFVLCGTGTAYDEYRRQANNYRNIILPGYVNQKYIAYLMGISKVGIIPYFDRWDFKDAVPNKAVEYLAGGLPVLSELSGYYGEMLRISQCGCVYKNAGELVQLIENYYDDMQFWHNSHDNALKLFHTQFEKKKVYGEFCDFIERVAIADQSV